VEIDRFIKHKVFKHKNNVDVAFLITDINEEFHNEIHLRGYWMRITSMNNLSLLCHDVITVNVNDISNWSLFNGEEAYE
jgi:hypothetical protein